MWSERVRFHPWVGDRYSDEGFLGRKLLIVGESHYSTWPENGVPIHHCLDADFTNVCVKGVMGGDGATYWRRVQFRIAGDEGRWTSPENFWPKVAFYNFVQSPVAGSAGSRPTWQQFEESAPILMDVLSSLKPDRVVFTGETLWRHVPPRSGHTSPITAGDLSIPQEWFDLTDSHRVYVTKIAHPRSSKCKRALEPLIDTFIRSDPPAGARAYG